MFCHHFYCLCLCFLNCCLFSNLPQLMMRYPLLNDIIFIILLTRIRNTQTHFIDTSFDMVKQGQQITGKLGSAMLTGSPQECSLRYVQKTL